MKHRVIHRHECHNGDVIYVQKVGRSYVCTRVGPFVSDEPVTLAKGAGGLQGRVPVRSGK